MSDLLPLVGRLVFVSRAAQPRYHLLHVHAERATTQHHDPLSQRQDDIGSVAKSAQCTSIPDYALFFILASGAEAWSGFITASIVCPG